MSQYQNTAPSHGQKVSDPTAPRKAEHSGLVANDSLAADSLRSGGSFSKGNPTGISDVPGPKGTFAGEIGQDDIADVHYGKKKDNPVTLNKGEGVDRIPHLDNVGGGKQMEEAFSGNYEGASKASTTYTNKSEHKGGRGTQHTGGASNAQRHAEATTANKDESNLEAQPRRSARLQNKSHGPEEVPVRDTTSITDIGSEADAGRKAERQFENRNAGRDTSIASKFDTGNAAQTENQFDVLSEE